MQAYNDIMYPGKKAIQSRSNPLYSKSDPQQVALNNKTRPPRSFEKAFAIKTNVKGYKSN
jgi:hypothetical protein